MHGFVRWIDGPFTPADAKSLPRNLAVNLDDPGVIRVFVDKDEVVVTRSHLAGLIRVDDVAAAAVRTLLRQHLVGVFHIPLRQ